MGDIGKAVATTYPPPKLEIYAGEQWVAVPSSSDIKALNAKIDTLQATMEKIITLMTGEEQDECNKIYLSGRWYTERRVSNRRR